MEPLADAVFARTTPSRARLIRYGFREDGDSLTLTKPILNGDFDLTVRIAPSGAVTTGLTEPDTGEPYILYKVDQSVGGYVGLVREAVERELIAVRDACCDVSVFQSERTFQILRYAKERYGDDPEYLWEKFPDNAILRRKDNRHWYAAILTTKEKNIGLESDRKIELLLLRGDPARIDGKTVFPAWHMNKKSWISMVLDQRSGESELLEALDRSYERAT